MSVSSNAFLPYGRQALDEDDIAAVVAVLRGDFLTTGPTVTAFEEALCKKAGAKYCVVVCNGTAALHAAYFAAEVGEGDQVVVPAITFLATANAARYLNAEPWFVDVDPDTALMDLDSLRVALGRNPKLIVPVHMTGAPLDMAPIRAMADEVGAMVVEDAAHALGASYEGVPVGACEHSDMVIFSFHPVKHVTTGEGGAVLTNDEGLYRRLLAFRNHGMVKNPAALEKPSPGPWYYEQQTLGYNYRITDIQCALGISQLQKLDGFIARRRALAARYDELLEPVSAIQPVTVEAPMSKSAYHLYSVLIDFSAVGCSRAECMERLREYGIGTQVHYIPVPSQPYYAKRGWADIAFPGANSYYERTLSLPMFPTMSLQDLERVVEGLREVLGC